MNDERHVRGYRLAKEHHASGGTFESVTFKDEDEDDDGMAIGPVVAYRTGFNDGRPAVEEVPFDAPDPDGMFYLGWHRKSYAKKLAKDLNTRFEDV